jgi:hypothetical protein
MIYDGWRLERWETAISDLPVLAIDGLHSTDRLYIVVEAGPDPDRRRWLVVFDRYVAYLNMDEGYRLGLWSEGNTTNVTGNTRIVTDSPWLALLVESEPHLTAIFDKLVHYQIASGDDVIDIVAPEPAAIEQIGSRGLEDFMDFEDSIFKTPEARQLNERLVDRVETDKGMLDDLKVRGVDHTAYPCVHMAYYCTLPCSEQMDCPEAPVVKIDDGYAIPVRDGKTSVIEISHCPWCGTKLWFEWWERRR